MVLLPLRRGAFVFAISALLVQAVWAHREGTIVHHPLREVSVDKPIVIETSFLTGIRRSEVHYRMSGEAAFRVKEMRQRSNGSFAVTLDVSVQTGDMVEYYIAAETSTGDILTEPAEDPETRPHSINIIRRSSFQTEGIEAVLLSPEPGSTVNPADFFVAISIFADTIDVTKLQLKLDGKDVTKQADVTAELVTYSGKGIKEGEHEVRLWYAESADNIILLAEASFIVNAEGAEDIFSGKGFSQVATQSAEIGEGPTKFEEGKFHANFRSEYKGQTNLGTTINYKRAGGDLSYEKEWIRLGFTGDWDSEDDPEVNQPLSRYLFSANLANRLIVDFGDTYPVFSPVTLYGTRVRGISAAVNLGILNLQFVNGQINRAVISKEDKENRDIATTLLADTLDNDTVSFTGTFQRDIIGGRISLGPGSAQIGLSAFKAKDRQSSLKYNDETNAALFTGITPKENVVAGLDVKFSAWNKRINFDASVATGLTNEDITGGSVDQATLAAGGIDISQNTIDAVSNIITFNTNLNPLPLGELDKKNLFAYTAGGNINALNNNFAARYRYHGGYFQTYGASVSRDLESFEISDRIRLWQNRIFLTGSYATTSNNLLGTNSNTLETKNIGFQFAAYLPKMPTFTFGYNTIGRDNGFTYDESSQKFTEQIDGSSIPEDNTTNIISVSTSYATEISGLRNSFSLSFATSDKKDKTKDITDAISSTDTIATYYTAFGDANTNSFGLGVTTEWKFPLRTNVNLSITTGKTETLDSSQTSVEKSDTKATTFGLSGDYTAVNNQDMKLNVYGGLAITSYEIPGISPATLVTLTLGQRFNFYKRHTIYLDFNNTGGIEVQKFDDNGNPTGTKKESNRILTARYEFVF